MKDHIVGVYNVGILDRLLLLVYLCVFSTVDNQQELVCEERLLAVDMDLTLNEAASYKERVVQCECH